MAAARPMEKRQMPQATSEPSPSPSYALPADLKVLRVQENFKGILCKKTNKHIEYINILCIL